MITAASPTATGPPEVVEAITEHRLDDLRSFCRLVVERFALDADQGPGDAG